MHHNVEIYIKKSKYKIYASKVVNTVEPSKQTSMLQYITSSFFEHKIFARQVSEEENKYQV